MSHLGPKTLYSAKTNGDPLFSDERGNTLMGEIPNSLTRIITSMVQSARSLVEFLGPRDSRISSGSETCYAEQNNNDTSDDGQGEELTDIERKVAESSRTKKSSWLGMVLPLLWDDVKEVIAEMTKQIKILLPDSAAKIEQKSQPTDNSSGGQESHISTSDRILPENLKTPTAAGNFKQGVVATDKVGQRERLLTSEDDEHLLPKKGSQPRTGLIESRISLKP